MEYRRLFLWLEGPDDERFFDWVIVPKLRTRYHSVKIIKYSQMKKEKLENFIKSIKSMGADYIFVKDINNAPCVTAKKQIICQQLRDIDQDRIAIVIREIESWYLAGLGQNESKKLKIPHFDSTEAITKEQFNCLIPPRFTSRIDFLSEILKRFSVEAAKIKNRSFRYFIEKYGCEAKSSADDN
ncbi:hypothetical protein DRN39_06270 [Thermococci archaeon]|nr:MAG: hypothetical protein DRN39_06270 [Thermococci archaeon]